MLDPWGLAGPSSGGVAAGVRVRGCVCVVREAHYCSIIVVYILHSIGYDSIYCIWIVYIIVLYGIFLRIKRRMLPSMI